MSANTNKTAQRVIDVANVLGEVSIARDRLENVQLVARLGFMRALMQCKADQFEDGYWYLEPASQTSPDAPRSTKEA
jgi:hypothetical protein